MMNSRDKLLKRAIAQFPDVTELNVVSRYYPTSNERESGAFLWGIGSQNIGSCSTMTACIKAKEWKIINGTHYREIVPIED